MRRGTVVFIIFILIVAGIIGANQFLRDQPPLELTLAVDPLAENWIHDAVERFNATNPIVGGTQRISFTTVRVNDVEAWQRGAGWTFDNHPIAWLPSSSATLAYVPSNLPYQVVQPSTARTILVWGGFSNRVNTLTENGAEPFDWDAVASAAKAGSWESLGGQSDWQFVKLAFNRPGNSMGGLAVLFSAAANYGQSSAISADTVGSEFDNWFAPVYNSVPNFQTLGANPAQAMASRGTSIVDVALLPESQWLLSLNDLKKQSEPVIFSYPQMQIVLDFPLAIWNDSTTTDNQRAAVDALGNWLLNQQSQQVAITYGLRPAKTEPTTADSLFALAQPEGILLTPDLSSIVQTPPRNVVDQLMDKYD